MKAIKTASVFDKPVLMVYAVLPKIQARRKKLFGAAADLKTLQLFNNLQDHTSKIANASGLEIFWFFDHELPGKSFGERYSAAFASIFEKGYQKIISVGNDIPQLQISHIRRAAEILEKKSAVLGPTEDGGDYLIGISADVFQLELFRKLPWNTSDLHHKLNEYLEKNHSPIYTLEELIDVDDLKALDSIRKTYNLNWIKWLFQSLRHYISINIYSKPDFLMKRDNPLRAPPVFQLG